MGYFIRTVDAGAVREVEKWSRPTKEARRAAARAAKLNPTTAAQRQVNRRNSLARLRWAVNANFGPGDYWLTLTYSREHTPTEQSALADYSRFMRGLRALYRRIGAELKYIAVTAEPGRRPHIHVLASGVAQLTDIQALWPFGRISCKLLDGSGQYRALAEYIFKHGEGKSGRRWNASKNLIHPKPREREANAKQWRNEPQAPKGWRIDKEAGVERGINPITGAEFLRYSLIRLDAGKCREKRPRGCAGATLPRRISQIDEA